MGEIRGSVEYRNWEECPPYLLELLRCNQCGQGFLMCREDYDDGWGDFVRLWPSHGRPLSNAVPEKLRREHDEARKCYDSRAFTAAVVMVRRTLEGVCIEAGISERILVKSLKELQSRGMIDGRLADWAQELRVLGNEGAHYTGRPVSREDAVDALAFSEALLDYMFVLAAKFDEFKQRRAASSSDNAASQADAV
ncbi:DUF4145 domain-containing protein [Actinosynnema sp. ALI-1.44]|uniref:DUF4145 domain-containing protein n=1 Tax=Actinosynnema sp. ALI-1.44 TaxID=1933779 RepID=UPI00143D7B54|nr:DUF4145 domain-containing protein [Actinosynnema sp. ALI-1.44]